MSPLSAFGLADDADERAVRRAYAQRLKQARPDEDAASFQSLREAYEAALEWCREREYAVGLEAEERDPPPADVADTDVVAAAHAGTEPEALDFESFHEALLEHARRDDVPALRAWLEGEPTLWSIERKSVIGQTLLVNWWLEIDAMPYTAFDEIVRFFAMDAAYRDDAPGMLRRRKQAHASWALQRGDMGAMELVVPSRDGFEFFTTPEKIRILSRPFAYWSALSYTLIPTVPSSMHRFLDRLRDLDLESPPSIPAEQVVFWDAAGDRGRWSIARACVGLSRCFAYALIPWAFFSYASDAPFAWDPVGLAWLLGILLLAWLGGASVVTFRTRAERKEIEGGRNWFRIAWFAIWMIAICSHAYRAFTR